MPISPYLWLSGLLVLIMVMIFIAWILAEIVLARLEPGSDHYRVVRWWSRMLMWPVVIIGYTALPIVGTLFFLFAVTNLIGGVLASW